MAFSMIHNEDMWALEGRIDATTSNEFQGTLMDVVDQSKTDVLLDCKRLEFVSSAGLRVFLIAQKAMSERKCTLVLKNVPNSINKVFAMTGFDKFLKIEA